MVMGRKGEQLFTEAERDRIRQAVLRAESGTSGEIATMVVAESDTYREAAQLGAILIAASAALLLAVVLHHVTIWSYIPLVLLFLLPGLWLMKAFPRLKLSFVGRRRLEEAVRERALRAFYEQGLYRTRDETGILIFISILEHKVWILGDRGINRLIPPDRWKGLAAELAAGIRTGNGCAALCTVIQHCGSELSGHFPRRDDDQNELCDKVRD